MKNALFLDGAKLRITFNLKPEDESSSFSNSKRIEEVGEDTELFKKFHKLK